MKKKNSDIKTVDPQLWSNLNTILEHFPVEAGLYKLSDEQETSAVTSMHTRFKSGTRITEAYEKLNNFLGSAIVNELNTVMSDFNSISNYIKYIYKEMPNKKELRIKLESDDMQVEKFTVDNLKKRIFPIGNLDFTALKFSESSVINIETYLLSRVIFNLLEICIISGKDTFSSNENLITLLKNNPLSEDSFFLQAIRIEPCLLQTDIGTKILQSFSFWDRRSVDNFGTALKPQKKAKITSKLESKRQNSIIMKAILILNAIQPDLLKLKDRELLELLTDRPNPYCPKEIDLKVLTQIRLKAIGPK